MIRISKLTDYGILLLTHLADSTEVDRRWTARDLAERASLPLPTVGKLLKALSRGNFLDSERGPSGGYRLSRAPEDITIADVIGVLEGPISVTDCSKGGVGCEFERVCITRANWRRINDVVHRALKGLTLAEMRQTGVHSA